jgi:hypothetical protein
MIGEDAWFSLEVHLTGFITKRANIVRSKRADIASGEKSLPCRRKFRFSSAQKRRVDIDRQRIFRVSIETNLCRALQLEIIDNSRIYGQNTSVMPVIDDDHGEKTERRSLSQRIFLRPFSGKCAMQWILIVYPGNTI